VISDRNVALLAWFGDNRRQLPWRTTTDAYPVLVSEVMLQQTQVARVVPKFISFMNAWPDIISLAAADTDALLRAWSGLGYNSRALRLRETARIVAASGWPDSVDGLKALPGIGPYTAAAVGSISFGIEVPALDTNLKRVLGRWAGEPLRGPDLESYALDVLGGPAGDWNQSIMDLGSAICRASDPECEICPVTEWCLDPTIYEAPRQQSRFHGSPRQLRGALVRAHLEGADLHQVGQALNRSTAETAAAIDTLRAEGLLTPATAPEGSKR
jgi:A/G-specific adenine glycosylase